MSIPSNKFELFSYLVYTKENRLLKDHVTHKLPLLLIKKVTLWLLIPELQKLDNGDEVKALSLHCHLLYTSTIYRQLCNYSTISSNYSIAETIFFSGRHCLLCHLEVVLLFLLPQLQAKSKNKNSMLSPIH